MLRLYKEVERSVLLNVSMGDNQGEDNAIHQH